MNRDAIRSELADRLRIASTGPNVMAHLRTLLTEAADHLDGWDPWTLITDRKPMLYIDVQAETADGERFIGSLRANNLWAYGGRDGGNRLDVTRWRMRL